MVQTRPIQTETGILSFDPSIVKYKIVKDGAYYKVVSKGQSTYQNTSLVSAWNEARNGLTESRAFPEAIMLEGDLTLDGTLLLDDYTLIYLCGRITLANAVNDNMIENADGATGNKFIGIFGLGKACLLDGNKANQTSGNILYLVGKADTGYLYLPTYQLENLELRNAKEWGCNLLNQTSGTFQHIINKVGAHDGNSGGFRMQYIHDSKISQCYSGGNYGWYMVNCNGNEIANCYIASGGSGTNSLFMQTCQRNAFIGNTYDAAKNALVYMTGGCTQNVFSGGRFSNCNYTGTTGAYSAIQHAGTNYITKNIFANLMFRQSIAEQSKYCIEEIASYSNENIYSNLHMQNYATAGLRVLGADSKYDTDTIIGTVATS